MSASYNHKMEVRKGREVERLALLAAKELFSRYSSCDNKKEMPALKSIRDAILRSRPNDVKKKNPKEQTDAWFETLARQLLCGLFK